jgi:outer membrane immunogenic protein
MKKFLIGALLAGVATSAFAADLPTRKAPPPPYVPPPIFTWTGAYVGVVGSYGWGSLNGPNSGIFKDPDGGFGGITGGYNYQIGQFVVGLEGDLTWGDLSARNSLDGAGSFTKDRVGDLDTIRARAGFAFDRALIYATGGYAGGDVRTSYFNALSGAYFAHDSFQSGYAVGGGLEYAFTNNISAKAEYLFTSLGQTSYYAPQYVAKAGMDINQIRVGLNYRFR